MEAWIFLFLTILPLVTFYPQVVTAAGPPLYPRMEQGGRQGLLFLDVPLRRCSHGHPSRPPLTLTGQNQPRGVRLFGCVSSILVLRPVTGLPLWSQGPSTGCLNPQRLCGQRSSMWTSEHGCWACWPGCQELRWKPWLQADLQVTLHPACPQNAQTL